MAKITKVPNGPLIKKDGTSLRRGGVVKKAQNGDSTSAATMTPYMIKRAAQQKVKDANIRKRDSVLQRNANVAGISREELRKQQAKNDKKPDAQSYECNGPNFSSTSCPISKAAAKQEKRDWKKRKNGGPVKKAKSGAMIKRADGSYSKRGLWDNIRANKGSGKKPTAAMLKQEKKIKAKSKK
jgi:hypothetical protein